MAIPFFREKLLCLGVLSWLSTASFARAAVSAERTLSPWLVTQGSLTVEPAQRGLVVLVHGSIGYTMAPAYSLTSAGLREAPELLRSLPSDTHHAKDEDSVRGRRIAGKASLIGAWPRRADLIVDEMPDGGCAGCWKEYRWRGKRWLEKKQHEWLPTWFEPSGGYPASTIRFANGTTLWEKFELLDDGYPRGTSTFFLDPYGRRKAQRQRASGSNACGGGVRLDGRFSGVALKDGGLLSVGANCETQEVEAEYWRRGAVRSRILPLPGRPLGPIVWMPFLEPVVYCARSPQQIVIAFTAGPIGSDDSHPYVAHFDGSRFTELSPPVRGRVSDAQCRSDGSIWILSVIEEGTASLWRHSWPHGSSGTWEDLTPQQARGASELSLEFDGKNRPWLIADGRLLGYDGSAWVRYSLPALSGADEPCSADSLHWLGNDPVVLASCEGRRALMLEQAPEQVIER